MNVTNNLINQFQALNHESQQAFYDDLSFKDRDLFLKIIEKNGNVKLNETESKSLMEKLGKIKEMNISSKKSDSPQILKTISSFIGDVAYLFHILTADKLDQLVTQHFQETEKKEMEDWKQELINEVLENPALIGFYIGDMDINRNLNENLNKEKEFISHDLINRGELFNLLIEKHPNKKDMIYEFISKIEK